MLALRIEIDRCRAEIALWNLLRCVNPRAVRPNSDQLTSFYKSSYWQLYRDQILNKQS
jgi:hypothetical protein